MILELKDFHVNIEGSEIIKGIDIELGQNESIGILGISGAGKSVTFRSILGVDEKITYEGKLYYKGDRVKGNLNNYLKKDIGYITQDVQNSLNPYINVIDQMTTDLRFVYDMDKNTARKTVIDSLERLGIDRDNQSKFPDEFSGGMKQRVVVSMILNRYPELLIADEISSSLDKYSSELTISLLEEHIKNNKMSLIYISHNPYDAIRLCDRIYVFKDGRIIENKPSDEIFNTDVKEVKELLEAGKIIYGKDIRDK